jgi:hypothetical protein
MSHRWLAGPIEHAYGTFGPSPIAASLGLKEQP